MSSSVHPHEMSSKTENVDSGVDIKTCTSPLAFTVNFDDDNDEDEDRRNNNNNNNNSNGSGNQPHKKLLNLQDGFSRFSPKSSRFTSSKSTSKQQHLPEEEEKKKRSSLVAKEEDEDGSETGTYTIDDEDDIEGEESESTKEGSWNEISTSRDEDWISRWAEEQARQQQKIKQQRRRNKTPPNAGGQLDNSDENCRFRRKLPRLPSSSNHSNDSRETEDLLKDTLSVVNAMEARIEESASHHETPAHHKAAKKTQRPLKASASRVSSSSSLKNERLLGAAVAAKKAAVPDAKELAKMSELEAWKRRKNYRPTPLGNTPPKLRASADRITSGASEGGGRITRAALRSSAISNNSVSKSGSGNKKICSKASNNHPGRSTSSMSSKDAEFQAWKRRKNYNPLQAVANSKKKSSATTTQGATSVGNSLGNSTSSTPSPRHVDRGIAPDDYENERTLHSLQGLKVSSNTSSVMPPRSASFHYPEGGQLKLSSSLINFTSDEDEEELESLDFDDTTSCSQVGNHLKQHRLQQQSSRSSLLGSGNKSQSRKLLNDGDLSESTTSNTIVRIPSSSSGLGGSPSKGALSSKSHQKLEALDNLVISTIFSVSTKLCISSQNLLQKVRTPDLELSSIIDTLLYVLDDTDPPVSPSKKTSRELSGTLRNLKKVEQVLQVLERLHAEDEEE